MFLSCSRLLILDALLGGIQVPDKECPNVDKMYSFVDMKREVDFPLNLVPLAG